MTHDYDDFIGIQCRSIPWVPTIAHIVRRSAILDHLRSFVPGRVLEMGCGSGAFLVDLARRGYTGVGVDSSDLARQVAHQVLIDHSSKFMVLRSLDDLEQNNFNYLFAFEVLEHIENDLEVLTNWKHFLGPGGVCVLSVPAHMSQWGVSDEWAGHVRRYEKNELIQLATQAGFEIDLVASYGFPLLNILRPLREVISKLKISKNKTSIAQSTSKSGVDRTSENKIFFLYANQLSKLILKLFCNLQSKFYKSNYGTGYIIVLKNN